jgi:hypothetical protein
MYDINIFILQIMCSQQAMLLSLVDNMELIYHGKKFLHHAFVKFMLY